MFPVWGWKPSSGVECAYMCGALGSITTPKTDRQNRS